MSVRERLEDARVLAANGRLEGAFVQVLIAAAATSRERYTRDEWDDADSFKNFIYDELGVMLDGAKYEVKFPFRGRLTPLEDILYEHLRCQLVHEGALPGDVRFTPPVVSPSGGLANAWHLGDPFGIPAGTLEGLATAVWLAPENDALWPDQIEQRNRARDEPKTHWERHRFCRRPGQRTRKQKGAKDRTAWSHDGRAFAATYPLGTTKEQLVESFRAKLQELET